MSRVNVSAFHAEMIFFPENITTTDHYCVLTSEVRILPPHPHAPSKAFKGAPLDEHMRERGGAASRLNRCQSCRWSVGAAAPRRFSRSILAPRRQRRSASARGGGARGAALWACDMTTPHSRMQCSMWSNSHDAHLEEPYFPVTPGMNIVLKPRPRQTLHHFASIEGSC